MDNCRLCNKIIKSVTDEKGRDLCPKCLKLELSLVKTAKRLYD
jgi:hypothetical protein